MMNAPASERGFRELVGQLLEFHKREAKQVQGDGAVDTVIPSLAG